MYMSGIMWCPEFGKTLYSGWGGACTSTRRTAARILFMLCPNIDHAIACEWRLAIIPAKCSRTQNFELCERKDRSTCTPNLVDLRCSPASISKVRKLIVSSEICSFRTLTSLTCSIAKRLPQQVHLWIANSTQVDLQTGARSKCRKPFVYLKQPSEY